MSGCHKQLLSTRSVTPTSDHSYYTYDDVFRTLRNINNIIYRVIRKWCYKNNENDILSRSIFVIQFLITLYVTNCLDIMMYIIIYTRTGKLLHCLYVCVLVGYFRTRDVLFELGVYKYYTQFPRPIKTGTGLRQKINILLTSNLRAATSLSYESLRYTTVRLSAVAYYRELFLLKSNYFTLL